MKTFLQELEEIAIAATEQFTLSFSAAYINKTSGVAGAPAITAANVGKLAGLVAATTAITHISNVVSAQTATPAV